MVDALALGASGAIHAGSIPALDTNLSFTERLWQVNKGVEQAEARLMPSQVRVKYQQIFIRDDSRP